MGTREALAYYNRRRRVERSVLPWTEGEELTEVGLMRKNDDVAYVNSTDGVCGAVPPTHREGTESDGTVDWTFAYPLPLPIR